jgi:hypothetical protein
MSTHDSPASRRAHTPVTITSGSASPTTPNPDRPPERAARRTTPSHPPPSSGARSPTPNTDNPGGDASPRTPDTGRPRRARAQPATPATPRSTEPSRSRPATPATAHQHRRPTTPGGPTTHTSPPATPKTTPHPSPRPQRQLGPRTRPARPRRATDATQTVHRPMACQLPHCRVVPALHRERHSLIRRRRPLDDPAWPLGACHCLLLSLNYIDHFVTTTVGVARSVGKGQARGTEGGQ